MNKKLLTLQVLLILVIQLFAQANLKSPDEFLPHKVGEQFTPHHLLVAYFQHVAANSDNMILKEYGRTNEGRPLLLAIVSSKENIAKIEQIRKDNLIRAGILKGQISDNKPIAIVWLGHSVHGNEAAGSESSMKTLYKLVNKNNREVQSWLDNTVVLIDPSLNPDGYSRYTHWYRRNCNVINNPSTDDVSHREPWPGGRANHYFFDLNRDWVWQTQVESQQRVKIYQEWLPHVQADIHEQGINEPYYFAPAAQPFHRYITDWQANFQTEIGKNHAKYFDKNGWLYFTKEIFDLFYPSYADTYSTFMGAVGMTYEQGGSSRCGRGVLMNNMDTLTLMDRVMHHHTTAISTLEVSSKNAKRLVEEFQKYYDRSKNNPVGKYKSYLIKGNNSKEKLKALCQLLDKNNITYGKAKSKRSVRGYHYQSGKELSTQITADDLIVSVYQPHGVLVQTLFEPKSELVDSLTYDITAWALPYAYGLDAYALKDKLAVEKTDINNNINITNNVKNAYAYLVPWKSVSNAKFLAAIFQKGIKVRRADRPFEIEGKSYDRGTLLITRADNRKLGKRFYNIVNTLSQKMNQEVTPIKTGFASRGNDLGSSKMQLLHRPKVLVLTDEGTSSLSFGEVWYYFEQLLHYPLTKTRVAAFSNINLEHYNILILPEGSYGDMDSSAIDKLKSWVKSGGKVIAIGKAVSILVDKASLGFEKVKAKKEKSKHSPAQEPYENRLRKSISNYLPGAIYQVQMDNSYPLAYGMGKTYFSLKTNSTAFKGVKHGINVGYINDKPFELGFVGSKVKSRLKNSTVFAVEQMGRGSIVYLVDNPLFRGFWNEGAFLFSNALFFVGQ